MSKTSILLGSAAAVMGAALCSTGATLTPTALSCPTDFPVVKGDTDCAGDPCLNTDFADTKCCKAFVPTCGVMTFGGVAFADTACGTGKVYDSTTAAVLAPDDTKCCKAATCTDVDTPTGCVTPVCTDVDTPYAGCTTPVCTDVDTPYAGCTAAATFVPTCGELTSGGAAFSNCGTDKVYDSTTAAVLAPDAAKCCKAPCTAVDTPTGCVTPVCTAVDTPYAGCTTPVCTAVDTPYAGCTAAAGALCTTGASLTPALTCGTGYKAKAATSKCADAACVAADYTGIGAANPCCEVKASPTDSGASSLLPNFLFAAAGLIAWY